MIIDFCFYFSFFVFFFMGGGEEFVGGEINI